MTGNVVRLKRCPICAKPMAAEYRPFCSRRCADIDLGKWFGETYTVPAVEPPDGFELEAYADMLERGDSDDER
jgi:endogenous inhibitor of DNA gyrase (YacG/DUF329 family)